MAEKMRRKTKRVFDKAKGRFVEKAPKVHPGGAWGWWREAAGTDKPGKGALAKRRKKVVDENVKKGGG